MTIVPFDLSKHKEAMEECLMQRDLPSTLTSDLPAFGLVAFDENHRPIALGFIRQMEGPYAMLDSYITNPAQAPEVRDTALDRVTKKLIKIAKHNKINSLIAFSADTHTIMRAVSNGFILGPHVFSVLDLRGSECRS